MVAELTGRNSLRASIDEVASRDPVLADLVVRVGPIRHRPRDPDGPFAALVRAIVFQQLAGRAAQAIYGRVRAAVGDTLTPEALNAASDETLRAAGLSGNKLASLRDLSVKVLNGTVVLSRTSRRSDEELIERLTTVRGIGRWTAEMYLMFQLRRPDIWPVDDLGVRQGYALAWRLGQPPTPKQLEPLGERFRPYRSIVARYCWAAVPLLRPEGTAVTLRQGDAPPPPGDTGDMVRVCIACHPLTATAALVWNGDLPRPLQQLLFDTANAASPSASHRPRQPGRGTKTPPN